MTKYTFIPLMLVTILLSCNQKNHTDSGSSTATQASSIVDIQDGISISDLKPVSEEYKFPVVHFAKNKTIEEKINTFLQLESLEHLPGVYKKSPFENVRPADGSISGTTSFYGWNRNKTIPEILSLALEGEYVGAYPEGFTIYFNFDTGTGNKISLKDLFTENGQGAIVRMLNENVSKTIKDHLDSLKNKPLSPPANDEDVEMRNDAIAMYEDCLETTMDYKLTDYSFLFDKNNIVFERGRCSNHAMRPLDELDRFSIPMSFTKVKKHLTPYGENLLNSSGKAMSTISPEGKLYKGFINGKYAIGAIISSINEDGSLTMQYWYDKSKTPIEWNGTYSNQHFSMKEGDAAQIEADWKDNKIIGTWTDLKKKQPLKLELIAY
jgi:hypothetical protein